MWRVPDYFPGQDVDDAFIAGIRLQLPVPSVAVLENFSGGCPAKVGGCQNDLGVLALPQRRRLPVEAFLDFPFEGRNRPEQALGLLFRRPLAVFSAFPVHLIGDVSVDPKVVTQVQLDNEGGRLEVNAEFAGHERQSVLVPLFPPLVARGPLSSVARGELFNPIFRSGRETGGVADFERDVTTIFDYSAAP
jgi:hypothetical protein